MIAIKGRIAGKDTKSKPAYLDILVGSDLFFIGHRVYCTTETIESSIHTHIELLVQDIHREESYTLYGFKTTEQKDTFNLLRKVKGIGGNSALLVLDSIDNIESLHQAIKDGDSAYFVKFKGIGKTTANNIINDLKNKI